MQVTSTKTITISAKDVANILAAYFQSQFAGSDLNVSFNVQDVADDRFGGHDYQVVSASITGKSKLDLPEDGIKGPRFH
jgi:hypothetical protein